MGLPGIFEALNVNAVLGSSRPSPLSFGSWGFTASGPATMPRPVSTSAWPREPALDPRSGISLRAWKFRGLRPLTTIGAVVDSARATFVPFANDPITLRCSTKCCCSSFRLPLLAVALLSPRVSSCLANTSSFLPFPFPSLSLLGGAPGREKRALTFETANGASR